MDLPVPASEAPEPARSCGVLRACLGAGLLLVALALQAADAVTVHRVRIADQQPPCADGRSNLPIVPNDPASITLPGGERRCYGTRPPEMELWLPDGHIVWLSSQAPSPAAWIDLGPILVDPGSLDPPPLGLRITGAGSDLVLETRFASAATLTPIEPERWQPVNSADGRTFWVWVETSPMAGDG